MKTITEDGVVFRLRERPETEFTISVPNDVIETLEKIAAARDLSIAALID
ncbi:MAG: ribbon-helix-helix protein, CopG family, partial [Pyrinomonadaceae bacterium]